MKDETKSLMATTQFVVAAEIHHHHPHDSWNQNLHEPTNIKDVINELEKECTRRLKDITIETNGIESSPITLIHDSDSAGFNSIVESCSSPLSGEMAVVQQLHREKVTWEEDGCSSSVDEIEEDCSDLTSSGRTDSNNSSDESDAITRSPVSGLGSGAHSETSLKHLRRRSVSLTEDCCGGGGGPGSAAGWVCGHREVECMDQLNVINGPKLNGYFNGIVGEKGTSPAGARTYSMGGCSYHHHGSHGCGGHGNGSGGGSYVRYDKPSQVPYNRNPKYAGLNFNTNLRRPPENWLRMRSASQGSGHPGWGRHGAPYWSYPYSKTSSWSMFAFRYTGRGRRPFHKGLANNLVCLCCGCCNCSRVNQTLCCCCFHCVHRISSCRRPDLTKPLRPLGPASGTDKNGPRKSITNSLQQSSTNGVGPGGGGGSEGENSGICEASGSGQAVAHCSGIVGDTESGLESGMDSGTESTSGRTSERSKKKSSSSGSGKSSTTAPSCNERISKSYKLSTLF